jgi:hypothetical protein
VNVSPSWLFAVGTATGPGFALRCRDELGLRLPGAADVPPPATGSPSVEPDLDPDLAVHWLAWWRLLLDDESARFHREVLGRDRSDAEEVPFPDPLDLLEHGPLHRLAVGVAAVPRPFAVLPARREPFRPPVPDAAVRDAVADVARAHGVPARTLFGRVGLVPGPVGWRAVVRPGYGLMVADPSDDEDELHRFVRAVLESEVLGRRP